MAQRREDARFAVEPRETIGIDDKDRRQDLDRDISPERHVARAIDLAHASRANERQQLVGAGASGQLSEHVHGRPFRKAAGRRMRGEQRLDFSLQHAIVAARVLEKRVAIVRRAFDRPPETAP